MENKRRMEKLKAKQAKLEEINHAAAGGMMGDEDEGISLKAAVKVGSKKKKVN
jgi:hypothetical protein